MSSGWLQAGLEPWHLCLHFTSVLFPPSPLGFLEQGLIQWTLGDKWKLPPATATFLLGTRSHLVNPEIMMARLHLIKITWFDSNPSGHAEDPPPLTTHTHTHTHYCPHSPFYKISKSVSRLKTQGYGYGFPCLPGIATLITVRWRRKGIKRKIRKYFEPNENEPTYNTNVHGIQLKQYLEANL